MQLAPGEKVLPADSLRGLHTPKTEYSLETHSQDATVLPGHTNPEPGWPRCNTSALPNPTCSLLADNLRSPPTPTSGTVAQAQPFSAPAALHRACPVSTLGGAGRAFPPASTSVRETRAPQTLVTLHTNSWVCTCLLVQHSGHQGCEPGQARTPTPRIPHSGLAHRQARHPPTWQEEEWAAVITRPVPILGLQPHVERHPIQSPLTGCVGFGQVSKVTSLQRREERRAEGSGARPKDPESLPAEVEIMRRFSCFQQKPEVL